MLQMRADGWDGRESWRVKTMRCAAGQRSAAQHARTAHAAVRRPIQG